MNRLVDDCVRHEIPVTSVCTSVCTSEEPVLFRIHSSSSTSLLAYFFIETEDVFADTSLHNNSSVASVDDPMKRRLTDLQLFDHLIINLMTMKITLLISVFFFSSPSSCDPLSLVSTAPSSPLSSSSPHHSFRRQELPSLPPDVNEALTSSHLGRNSPDVVLRAWKEFVQRSPFWAESWSSGWREKLTKITTPKPKNGTSAVQLSHECHSSLLKTLDSFNNMEEWAIRREYYKRKDDSRSDNI